MMLGILLAAGASTRMGHPKALARSGTESFLVRGLRSLWSACDGVMIVLGSRAPIVRRRTEQEFERLVGAGRLGETLQHARRHGTNGLEAHFTVNRQWQRGMLSSVREGLRAARPFRAEALLVLPVDHPDVSAATVRALAGLLHEALRAHRTAKQRAAFSYALIPRFGGRRGHPIALTPALAEAILADRDATDLSDAVKRNARLVGYVDVRDPNVLRNRNTPRD